MSVLLMRMDPGRSPKILATLSTRRTMKLPHFWLRIIRPCILLPTGDIFITGMLTDRAFALFDLERYEEALEWSQRARLSPNPRTMTFALFAAVLSKLGRHDEACAAVNDLLKHHDTSKPLGLARVRSVSLIENIALNDCQMRFSAKETFQVLSRARR